jgi:L-aspartate oxidase
VNAPGHRPEVVIVGSGIAGLTAALELGHGTVLTRTTLGEGSSRWAQGGLAAAVGPGDSPADHAEDTRGVSSGLTVDAVVDMVTGDAPGRIRWLEQLGAGFDLAADGTLALGREAGHRARRIVHAGGDATGAAVMRALVAAVRAHPDIEVVEQYRAVDLIRTAGRTVGVTAAGPDGRLRVLRADAVVLATGGIGRVFSRTTNPAEATGDGLAMALRAGASIRDPEFVQFHPTALDHALDPLPLLTEALRGDGATLIDATGHRYLSGRHPDAELAPRDVVARANWAAQQRGPIFLDARGIDAAPRFAERFPTVFAACGAAGLDPRREPIPVTPAQHYHVGGILTDAWGRSDLPGLYACGETASIGLHGANRLASNSLVEGLVLGGRVAASISRSTPRLPRRASRVASSSGPEVPAASPDPGAPDDPEAIQQLRSTMWRHGGLVRDADGLTEAIDVVASLRPRLDTSVTGRNLGDVADLVLRAALARQESRGGHHRADHPATRPGAGQHTIVEDDTVAHRPLETFDARDEPVAS